MLIAIDHGNYAVKTTNHSFISGLSEHTVKLLRECLILPGKQMHL